MFTKVGNQKTLSHTVQDQIVSAILAKKLNPGDKLPTEKELCDLFGVSRTAVREAIQKLNAQGLVRVKKGSGTYVTDYTPGSAVKPLSMYLEMNLSKDLINDVIAVRKLMEPQVAAMAAANHNEEDLKAIAKTIEDLRKTSNYVRQGEIDHDFHMAIANAAHNQVLVMMFNPILKLMPKIRSVVYKVVDTAMSDALIYHIEIYELIKKRDEDGARRAMEGHLKVAEEHSNKILGNLNIA